VYRVRFGRDTLYLRIWPFADESFESEALILSELQRRGVRVPKVLGWDAFHPLIGRSYLLTSEVPGRPLAPDDAPTLIESVLREAGRELAILNGVPVEGFGWIVRTPANATPLRGEHPTSRSFLSEYLRADLELLAASVFGPLEVIAMRRCIEDHPAWFDAPNARLAHGDFDTTPILHADGRYTGIIDFSEVRGTSRMYDLGHFHLHDGDRLPVTSFRWLVEGYRQQTCLPADYEEQVAFQGLLIGLRRLARSLRVRPEAVGYQQLMANGVRRELALLARGADESVTKGLLCRRRRCALI